MSAARRPGAGPALRDWAIAAAFALAVASIVFVGHRNRELDARQRAWASVAASAVEHGEIPVEIDAAGVVGAARPSPRYPFLRQRWLVGERGAGRAGRVTAIATPPRVGSAATARPLPSGRSAAKAPPASQRAAAS